MPMLELNGERFHYHVDDFSDPWRSAETVLLHHSAGGNLHRWRPWVPTLARRHPTLRFDMRGHAGTTSRSASPFVITELAADIARVMDALEVDKTHLVGASAGGIVSLQFAHDFPDRLHSLTLVASTPRLAQMGANMDASGWGDTLQREGTRAWLLSDTDKRFGPDTPREVIDWYADEGAKTEASAVLALQACLLAADLAPLLPQINAPTLILAARRDPITPLEAQQLMAQMMPNATLEIFDGVGHNMKVEIPETLARRTLDFIEGVNVEGANVLQLPT